MRVEVATGYRIGEIAYTAGVLVDELIKTEVPGTEVWPHVRDLWIDHIRGKKPYDYDLSAQGLKVGYRGYLENIQRIQTRGLSLIFEEPRILVSVDETKLLEQQFASVVDVVRSVSSLYDLIPNLPPTSLVFPKIFYAKEIIVYDTDVSDLHKLH